MNASPENPRRLLPHEIAFGLFMIALWARLVVARGFFDSDALALFAGIGLNAWLTARRWTAPTPFNWRLSLIFYPIAMNVFFALMRDAVPKVQPVSADAWLQRVDTALIGTNLSLRLEPLVHPVVTEFLSGCYFLFFPFLGFSIIYYVIGDLAGVGTVGGDGRAISHAAGRVGHYAGE